MFSRQKRFFVLFLLVTMSFSRLALADPIDDAMVREDSSHLVTKSVDARVKVYESDVLREINDHMLGIQYSGNHSIFDSIYTTEISKNFIDFSKTLYKIPLARYGGYQTNGMNFFDHIGPMSQRRMSVWSDVEYDVESRGKTTGISAHQFGPVEWIKSVHINNPDAEFIICLSVQSATPEENANFARFLLDRVEDSHWGALRASYGLKEPVNILAFEMGNEVDLFSKVGNRFWLDEELLDWYNDISRKNIDAIKAIYPDAKFMACGKSSPDVNDPLDWRIWNRKIAQEWGEDLHYFAFHLYYSGYHLVHTQSWLDDTTEDLKSVLGEDYKVKMYLTEHATWYDYPNSSKMVSLYACLATSQFFNRMYMRDDIYGANYHNWTGDGNWWSVFKNLDGKWVKMGLAILYEEWQKNLGDRIVNIEVESDNLITDKNSTAQRFTVIATPSGDYEMTLALNNMSDDTELNLTFDFENKYTLIGETIFTAPNLKSYVSSLNTADVFTVNTTEKNVPSFNTYKMPAKSTVFLNLKTDTKLPRATLNSVKTDIPKYTGDDLFYDISHNWAKNEINLMAEKGIISGTAPGYFEPSKSVTRAEAAKIIANSLNLRMIEYTKIFNDVYKDDWFAPYVLATFANGFVRGNEDSLFIPEGYLTIEQLAVTCQRIVSSICPELSSKGDRQYLENFNYSSGISPWAVDSVAFCVEHGLFYRMYETNDLITSRNATRAEIASVLYRIINNWGRDIN